MADSYRPSRPGRNRPPPLADRMTFTSGEGSSHESHKPGNSQRRQQSGGRNPPQSEFTFSAGPQGPQFPPTGPGGSKRSNESRAPPVNPQSDRRNQRNFPRGRARPFRKAAPHERPLLQTSGGSSPEHVLGVPNGPNKFMSLDDLSDDEETDMELESDKSPGEDANGQETNHKVACVKSSTRADGNSVPKWSNPDPYTSAPPPEETTGKRRDFVKIIRKAKNQAAEKAATNNAVTANDDFISFGDDDEEPVTESVVPPPPSWLPPPPPPPDGLILEGSMNEIAANEALKNARRKPQLSVDATNIPKKTPNAGKAHKRKRDEFESAILPNWLPVQNSHPTPWINGKSYVHLAQQPHHWLHNEILDFFDYVRPQSHDKTVRNNLVKRLEQVLGQNRLAPHKAQLYCFGSFPAGVYLPTADMDLVYATEQHYNGGPQTVDLSASNIAKQILFGTSNVLRRKKVANNVVCIHKAKVPIVKFEDSLTGIHVDICFENLSGLRAQSTFRKWKGDYPDLTVFVLVIKQFLAMRGLNDVHTGGLGGFSIICLVVTFFEFAQVRDNLGERLLDFFDFYGNQFDLATQRIAMNPPAILVKGTIGIDGRPEKQSGLSIQDPNIPNNNISGGSHKVKDVFKAFSEAHKALTERMHAVCTGRVASQSMLEAVIGGNYQSYQEHRDHIASLR